MTCFAQLNSEKSRVNTERREVVHVSVCLTIIDVIKNKAFLWSTSEKFSTGPCFKEMRRERYKP